MPNENSGTQGTVKNPLILDHWFCSHCTIWIYIVIFTYTMPNEHKYFMTQIIIFTTVWSVLWSFHCGWMIEILLFSVLSNEWDAYFWKTNLPTSNIECREVPDSVIKLFKFVSYLRSKRGFLIGFVC